MRGRPRRLLSPWLWVAVIATFGGVFLKLVRDANHDYAGRWDVVGAEPGAGDWTDREDEIRDMANRSMMFIDLRLNGRFEFDAMRFCGSCPDYGPGAIGRWRASKDGIRLRSDPRYANQWGNLSNLMTLEHRRDNRLALELQSDDKKRTYYLLFRRSGRFGLFSEIEDWFPRGW
ncbi:MAG: hypothetical protein IH851_05180 [Armatimonadetes bacterium]|nr:hypothetical protein [Armatimonadota bacterium]